MYCSNCGKKINETDEICPYCKSKQKTEEEIIEEEKKEIEVKEKINKSADKALEIGLAFLIIMICFDLYVLIKLLIFKEEMISDTVVIPTSISILIWLIGNMFFLFSKMRYNLSLKAFLLSFAYGCLGVLPIAIFIISIISKCS